MPNSIPAVERKRERNSKLRRSLQRQRPSTKRRSQARRSDIPSEERGNEVREPERVEAGGEEEARCAVGDREHGGDLPFVDCEVGGGGTLFALFDEDVVGGFGG